MIMLEISELKDLIEKCALCGACASVFDTSTAACPSGMFYQFEPYFPWGRLILGKAFLENKFDISGEGVSSGSSFLEKLYACTLCNNCGQQCELGLGKDMVGIFQALRAEAVKRGLILPAHERILKSLAEHENIYSRPNAERNEWARNIRLKRLPEERADVLYFAGCASSLDPATQVLARATARLLLGAGIDAGVLAEEEVCCGAPALMTGDREAFHRLADKNIELINRTGARTVVTSCAECLKTIRCDYPDGLEPEVVHITEFIDRLLLKDEICFTREVNLTAAYHDPCQLGRGAGVFDAPRRVLERIPGVVLREMPRTRQNAFCCGAGGGVTAAFPEMASFTAKERLKEAEATGSTHLITACPFCFQAFSRAIKDTDSRMKLMDMVQVVGQAI
jgi:Fe-S oxidoreductase